MMRDHRCLYRAYYDDGEDDDEDECVDTFEVPDASDDGGNHTVCQERSRFRCVDCGMECGLPMGFEEVECS